MIAYCNFRLNAVTGKVYFVYQLSQNKKFQFGFHFIYPDAGFYYHNTEEKSCILLRIVLAFNSRSFPTAFFFSQVLSLNSFALEIWLF